MKVRGMIDFVNDMIHKGRTEMEVRSIARNSRWKYEFDEVMKLYKEKTKETAKKG